MQAATLPSLERPKVISMKLQSRSKITLPSFPNIRSGASDSRMTFIASGVRVVRMGRGLIHSQGCVYTTDGRKKKEKMFFTLARRKRTVVEEKVVFTQKTEMKKRKKQCVFGIFS